MRSSSLTTVAAAVLAAGACALLTGCTEPPSEAAATSPVPAASSQPADRPLPPAETSTDRAPLGFEVRYVDSDGRFRTVAPENFPR